MRYERTTMTSGPGAGRLCEVQYWHFHELLELVHRMPEHDYNRRYWGGVLSAGTRRGEKKTAWRGGLTVDELLRMSDWPEGRELMARYSCELSDLAEITSIKRKRSWGEEGDEFSRDRFDAGYQECWSRRRRVKTRGVGRVLRMTIELGGGFDTRAKDLAWSGAAAAVLCDRLEEAGYRVEIEIIKTNIGLCAHRRYDYAANRIMLKQADEPLSVDTLLLAASCPGFFRFHGFRAYMEYPWKVRDNLGWSVPTDESMRGDIHIAQVRSQADAQQMLDRAAQQIVTESANRENEPVAA